MSLYQLFMECRGLPGAGVMAVSRETWPGVTVWQSRPGPRVWSASPGVMGSLHHCSPLWLLLEQAQARLRTVQPPQGGTAGDRTRVRIPACPQIRRCPVCLSPVQAPAFSVRVPSRRPPGWGLPLPSRVLQAAGGASLSSGRCPSGPSPRPAVRSLPAPQVLQALACGDP